MLIVGYCFGIRSERRLCEEVHLNLAYRWFCRLGLEDAVPEHSTFSKNRHGRFRESEAFRHVFETVLQRCMSEGLVGGEGFAIDASVVKADAARASAIPGAAIDYRALGPTQASRAVREYLEGLDADGRPETQRKNISITDPAAEWTCAPGGPAFFAYSTNYPVDVRYRQHRANDRIRNLRLIKSAENQPFSRRVFQQHRPKADIPVDTSLPQI
jgi:IS5 family transposase